MLNTLRRRVKASSSTPGADSLNAAAKSEPKADISSGDIDGSQNVPRSSPRAITAESRRAEIVRLWLQSKCRCAPGRLEHPIASLCSKLDVDPNSEAKRMHRKMDFENMRISIRLWWLLLPNICEVFWQNHKISSCLWLGRHAVAGILPTLSLWANSRLIDMVQQALISGPIELSQVLRAAAIAWLLRSFSDVFRILAERNDRSLEANIDDSMETIHLGNLWASPMSIQDQPFFRHLEYEAGLFTGFEYRYLPSSRYAHKWQPFDNLSAIVTAVSKLVSMLMQIALIVRTTRQVDYGIFSFQTLGLVTLAIAPLVCRWISEFFVIPYEDTWSEPLAAPEFLDNNEIRYMTFSRTSKQDITLFGLRDWLLQQWTSMKEAEQHARVAKYSVGGVTTLLSSTVVEYALGDVPNVLFATGLLSTGMSLGSIHLYQGAASSLYSSIRPLSKHTTRALQMIFHFAAFVEFSSGIEEAQHRHWRNESSSSGEPPIDYDDLRTGSGMRIEARNLGFAYQGKEPVLKNINLLVEAGETLAIIGGNGEGKSTLTKVLMGLYGHSGILTVDGRQIEEYDLRTLHKRTSCLFQDFRIYDMTVAHNIGLGHIDHIRDTEKIESAGVYGGVSEENMKLGLSWTAGDEVDKEESRDQTARKLSNPARQGIPFIVATIWSMILLLVKRAKCTLEAAPPPQRLHRPTYPRLSGGEQQRVALARAFMRVENADLIVFDEPSANLDPEAEQALFERIHSLSSSGGRKITTIFISHRVWTVRKADKIAVIENGTINECGTHDELMKLEGKYHKLYTLSQSRSDPIVKPSPKPSMKVDPWLSDENPAAVTPQDPDTKVMEDKTPSLRKTRSCSLL